MKSERTVKRELRRLRRYIEANPSPRDEDTTLRVRFAYEIECAIRWAREDGIRGWPNPLELALGAANVTGAELVGVRARRKER
jgi:hypothetical protein